MQKLRVLLVNDNSALQDGLKILIDTQSDLTVTGSVQNLRTAVRLAKKLEPDVVIMEWFTDRGDNLQAAASISSQSAPAKVLVLGDPGDDGSVRRSKARGVAGYLTKVNSAASLIRAIRKVGQGNGSFAPPSEPPLQSETSGKAPGGPSLAARGITAREAQVLNLIAEGMVNKQIASELRLSIKTVEKHRQALMDKLNIHSIALLTRYAISRHLIPLTREVG